MYIADSAMVTPKNLEEIGPNFFITRLPFSYKETDRVVAEAVADDCWLQVGGHRTGQVCAGKATQERSAHSPCSDVFHRWSHR